MAKTATTTQASKKTPAKKSVSKAKTSNSAKKDVLGEMTSDQIAALLAACQAKLKPENSVPIDMDDDDGDDNAPENDDVSTGGTEEAEARRTAAKPVEASSGDTEKVPAEPETIEELKASLKHAQAERDALQSQLASSKSSNDSTNDVASIPRPSGTAGTHFSIQEAMGLAGSDKKDSMYHALQRRIHDFVGFCKIDYQQTWKEIPAKKKSQLFESVRQDQPYLGRYVNDWATEELAKQYIKNKRKRAYVTGLIPVPTKFRHLKDNAAHRSTSGSRTKKAKTIRLAREQHKATKKLQKKNSGASTTDMQVPAN